LIPKRYISQSSGVVVSIFGDKTLPFRTLFFTTGSHLRLSFAPPPPPMLSLFSLSFSYEGVGLRRRIPIPLRNSYLPVLTEAAASIWLDFFAFCVRVTFSLFLLRDPGAECIYGRPDPTPGSSHRGRPMEDSFRLIGTPDRSRSKCPFKDLVTRRFLRLPALLSRRHSRPNDFLPSRQSPRGRASEFHAAL